MIILSFVAASLTAPCDLLESCRRPSSCPVFAESPPPVFDTVFYTTAGDFTIRSYTAWAPPYAKRFWQLGRLQYMAGAPFYRVDRINASVGWVVQFGYNGQPSVDQCWDEHQTLNTTWSVQPPGNVQGTVAFSMDAVKPSAAYPNCSSADYCARGFSTNIFINYQNNSARLDPPAFSPFGIVLPPGMDVVNKLYAGYGEVSELCPDGPTATTSTRRPDVFCVGRGAQCKGVDMDRLVKEGSAYVAKERPLLDSVKAVEVSEVDTKVDVPAAASKVSASRFRLLSEAEAPHRPEPTGSWYPKDEMRL
jgi:hypothetical protein